MKVKPHRIDPQLRLRGQLINLLQHATSYDGYVRSQRTRNWFISTFLHGRNLPGLSCGQIHIPRPDGSTIRTRIYRPLQPVANVPGVLWIHGGGYATGCPEQDGFFYRNLLHASPCIILAPDYCLSCHAPYPAALQDCYQTLLWMKQHAQELGIRADQLMVGGESAGGGLAAALTLYARNQRQVRIAFQMPLYPMLDDRMQTASMQGNHAPVWNSEINDFGWRLYLGPLYGKEDVPPYAAPARAQDFRGLPPAVTFVGDREPFRDEVAQYVENLRQSDIPVEFTVYPGCYHAFDMIAPKTKVSQQAAGFFQQAYRRAVATCFAPQSEG